MPCTRCDHPIVELTVQGLSSFSLRSCSNCDHRIWTIDGRAASVAEVAQSLQRHEVARKAAA
jgi:hypothetical protein